MALARIWMMEEGDICDECPMGPECADHRQCLHLAAGDGQSIEPGGARWTGLGGVHRRFPLGVRTVGGIAATGAPVLFEDAAQDTSWIHGPEWARQERIRSFVGLPLVFASEMLGVLGLFSRAPLNHESLAILQPFADQVAAAIANARSFARIEGLREQLELENAYLREEVQRPFPVDGMVGQSPAFEKVLRQIELVAATDSNVLVLGESGTGKELVARAIHARSVRSERPLVKVNCASISREGFAREFFGPARESCTGAVPDRRGRFELAGGGTLFLDEVSEIPLDFQSPLLRVLQEGQFEPSGGEGTRRADVRIIAATHRDLALEVKHERFRADLYYRLSVFPIEVPPLRARPEDIPLLADYFLQRVGAKHADSTLTFRKKDLLKLERYAWPGNVRELQSAVERAAITATRGRFSIDLPATAGEPPRQEGASGLPERSDGDLLTVEDLRALERRNIVRALERTQWKVSGKDGAAALLEMKPTTLASRIKALKVTRSHDSRRAPANPKGR